jgi:hypothetical protein
VTLALDVFADRFREHGTIGWLKEFLEEWPYEANKRREKPTKARMEKKAGRKMG